MKNKTKQFNMVMVGTGGQGQITLLQVLAEAALIEGFDVKTSELHGLSQRGGSVEVHIRFDKEVYSPLVGLGKADLILGLEMQETLKGALYANPKTRFLVNKQIMPIPLVEPLTEKEVLDSLRKVSKKIDLVAAADICQEKLGTGVVAGIYLITWAALKNLIPLKPQSILKAIKKTIPERHLDLNVKTFQLAKSSA